MLLRSRHSRISHAAVTARLWTLPRGLQLPQTAIVSIQTWCSVMLGQTQQVTPTRVTWHELHHTRSITDTFWLSQSLSRHLGTFSGSCSLTLKHLRSILGRHIRIQDGQTHLDFDFCKLCRSLHRLRWIRLSSTFRKMKISCFDRLGIDLVDTIVT